MVDSIEIRKQMDEYKHAIDIAKSLSRLEASPDFKATIQNELFGKKLNDLNLLLPTLTLNSDEYVKTIQEISAINYLRIYLLGLHEQGHIASMSLKDAEELLDEDEDAN